MVDRQPLARYAALSGVVELSDQFGVDVDVLFAGSGLDPAGLSQPDRWVPAAAVADLLERAATLSGAEDFGLRLAENRRLANLGPLSLVIREEPDLRGAVQTLIRYNHMYNQALHTRLIESDATATIRTELRFGQAAPARQSIELAVGSLFNILADLAGPRWRPLAVCFSHAGPADVSTHQRVFGIRVAFGHDFNGIVLRSADLDADNTLADPLLLPYAKQLLQVPDQATSDIVERTRELIELLLPAGRCSVDHVARNLGTNRRTLHRKLQKAGTTFTDLLDATRVDLAVRLVDNPDNSLTEVAEMLMFSSSSNFSRWFRDHFGTSPRAWRNRPPAS